MNTFKAFDIVIVPFPFADTEEVKKRPALVLSSHASFNKKIDHSILAMITSAHHKRWPLDVLIDDLSSCGLKKPSLIRLKLFTFDHRLIQAKIGILAPKDQEKLQQNMLLVFSEAFNILLN